MTLIEQVKTIVQGIKHMGQWKKMSMGSLRLKTPHGYCCPLTACHLLRTGRFLDLMDYNMADLGTDINRKDRAKLVLAADGWDPGPIREELIALVAKE